MFKKRLSKVLITNSLTNFFYVDVDIVWIGIFEILPNHSGTVAILGELLISLRINIGEEAAKMLSWNEAINWSCLC